MCACMRACRVRACLYVRVCACVCVRVYVCMHVCVRAIIVSMWPVAYSIRGMVLDMYIERQSAAALVDLASERKNQLVM